MNSWNQETGVTPVTIQHIMKVCKGHGGKAPCIL